MACLSKNTIRELVTVTLSEEARAQAQLHIERCAACRILVVELARDNDLEARDAGSAREKGVPQAAALGRYRLERELGTGAMGVVHAAFDPNLERRIALKVLRGSATFEARERLLREARAMARLVHLNVVTVYEVGFADGRDFIAMELIHGESLAEWLRQARRTPAAVLDAFFAAGRGLAAATLRVSCIATSSRTTCYAAAPGGSTSARCWRREGHTAGDREPHDLAAQFGRPQVGWERHRPRRPRAWRPPVSGAMRSPP